MKNRYRVFSEHQPKKANLWEEEVFHRCYQKLKCYVFCSVGFFSLQYLHPCICNTFGKSYWKHSWWWLPGGRQSIVPKLTQKAYSSDEKNELKLLQGLFVPYTGCPVCRVSGTRSGLLSPLWDPRSIKLTAPKSHLPQVAAVWHHIPFKLLKSPRSDKCASCPLLHTFGSFIGLKSRKICGCWNEKRCFCCWAS